MSGGNTKGGVTGSITRTAIDSAPFAIPSDDPMLVSNDEAKTTTLSWLNDYDDIANEKSVRASADLTWRISKNFSYNVRTGGNVVVHVIAPDGMACSCSRGKTAMVSWH